MTNLKKKESHFKATIIGVILLFQFRFISETFEMNCWLFMGPGLLEQVTNIPSEWKCLLSAVSASFN